jgi:uncharacterized repeat protein (TIGR01451 family)
MVPTLEHLEDRTAPATFKVVNAIPNNMSGESDQNSEISIGVNPTNQSQMVIGVFGNLSNPAPYFTSADGGNTWSFLQGINDFDKSINWAPSGTAYITPLENIGFFSDTISVYSSPSPATGVPFTQIPSSVLSTDFNDQPWVRTTTVNGVDHIYMTFNDLSLTPNSATVEFSVDGGNTWTQTTLEQGNPGAGQDAPCVRSAVNGNTVYAGFIRWTADNGNGTFASQVVVVKDTSGGTGGFTALGPLGTTVATTTTPFSPFASGGGPPPTLGSERVGSDLYLAVDPNNANHLYVCYVSVDPNTGLNLQVHVDESTDGGMTFKEVYAAPISNGFQSAEPALAVTASGEVALEYNAASTTSSGAPTLEVHYIDTTNDFGTFTDTTLMTMLDDGNAPRQFDPYLGDFNDIVAVGNNIYGVFTGSNNANGTEAVFPQGVTFQRNFSGTIGTSSFQLLDNSNNPVVPSIDPYFYTVQSQADLAVSKTGPAAVSAGTAATYTITLTNNGPGGASNVNLSDMVPAGVTITSASKISGPDTFAPATINPTMTSATFTATSVGTSGADVFQVVVAVPLNFTAGTTITDTATVSSGTTDPNPNNNTSSVTTLVDAPTVTVTATSSILTYNQSQTSVTLSAAVTSISGTVNEGKVTFTLKDTFGNVIGTATTSGTVTNNAVSVTYALPSALNAGTYTVLVSYTDVGGVFHDDGKDNSGTLTVLPAGATVTAGSATYTYVPNQAGIVLTATVTSAGGTVNEGKVTFTLTDKSGTVIGSATTSSTVSSGTVAAFYSLSAPLLIGTYTVGVSYSDTSPGNYVDNGLDNSGSITIVPTPATITAQPATVQASPLSQSVVLRATLTSSRSPVNEGTVIFTVRQGGAMVGQGAAAVIGSQAQSNVTLPSGQAPGTYTIQVAYQDPGGTYSDGGDVSSTLIVTPAATSTAATSIILPYSSGPQQVSVSGFVQSPYGTVNEGSVHFSIVLSNGQMVQSTNFVNFGSATGQLFLPAGLAPGTYALSAIYNGGPTFQTSSDDTQSLTILAPPTQSSTTERFKVTTSLFGTTVQPMAGDGTNNGPPLFLSIFQFPFPIVTGLAITAAGNFDVHLAGLFFGLFPMAMDVNFSPSGMLLSFSVP